MIIWPRCLELLLIMEPADPDFPPFSANFLELPNQNLWAREGTDPSLKKIEKWPSVVIPPI